MAKTNKKTKGKKAATTRRKGSAIPSGFHTVTPYLAVEGGVEAIEFYKKAFGAKEISRWRQQTPDGKVVHARFKIGDSLVMLSDSFGRAMPGQGQVILHIYAKDVDKLWRSALESGAKVEMPLDNMYWGERYGQLTDPFGHRWSVAMPVKMSKDERAAKEKEAMAMFAQGGPHTDTKQQ